MTRELALIRRRSSDLGEALMFSISRRAAVDIAAELVDAVFRLLRLRLRRLVRTRADACMAPDTTCYRQDAGI